MQNCKPQCFNEAYPVSQGLHVLCISIVCDMYVHDVSLHITHLAMCEIFYEHLYCKQ